MLATREFMLRARLNAKTLERWTQSGWLLPRRNGGTGRFSEADIARARLIRDLKKDMGINDEGVTVVLDLVDQVHGLRRTLRELLSAICAQSEDTRREIAVQIRAASGSYPPGERPAQASTGASHAGRSG
jgi:chaperone modulatory protein CbpM